MPVSQHILHTGQYGLIEIIIPTNTDPNGQAKGVNFHRGLKALGRALKTNQDWVELNGVVFRVKEGQIHKLHKASQVGRFWARFKEWCRLQWARWFNTFKKQPINTEKPAIVRPFNEAGIRLPLLHKQTERWGQPGDKVIDNCGPAVIKMLLDSYGVDTTSEKLLGIMQQFLTRQDAQITPPLKRSGGLINTDIVFFLQELKAQPILCQLSRNNLVKQAEDALREGKPLILLDTSIGKGHYYLLLKYDGQLHQFDSDRGHQILESYDFKKPGSYAIYAKAKPDETVLNTMPS